MNLTDLQTAASLLGVPVSALIIAMALWLTIGKWLRDVVIPRYVAASELQAKAMDDISHIMESLQHELRENRKISIENSERLARMDVKIDQLERRPGASRARGE